LEEQARLRGTLREVRRRRHGGAGRGQGSRRVQEGVGRPDPEELHRLSRKIRAKGLSRGMLRRLVIAALVLAVLGGAAFWFLTIPQTVSAGSLGPHQPNLENGRTMFIAGGCSGCHAVPEAEDKTRLGGGLALKSPFGTFYVPNISSDRSDGIGAWSEADFVTALSRGTSPDGRHCFPAFPYTSYQRMRIGAMRDLFAYIKTLP